MALKFCIDCGDGPALCATKRRMKLLLRIPSGLNLRQLQLDVRAALPQADDARIAINLV
jgi:hypothetical protein